MNNDEKYIILEQYRIYSDAKEAFTTRNFQTNRFYLVITLVLFLLLYIFHALTPSLMPIIVGSVVGMSICVMWWLNLDSYQFLIKVKFANVLEKIEEKLPVSPYKDEFLAFTQVKKDKKAIIFADFQKLLTIILFILFVIIFSNVATQTVINNINKYQY